jgi:hypothetical protein
VPFPPIPALARHVTGTIALSTLALGLGLGVGAWACGRGTAATATGGQHAPTTATTSTTIPTTTTTEAPTTTTTVTPPAPAPGDEIGDSLTVHGAFTPAPPGLVRLRADGLGTLAFGTDEDDAVRSLTAQLGSPHRGPTRTEVCGNVTMAEWESGGITAYFNKGRFQGWEAVRGGNTVTAEGIGVGSTVRAVRAAYGDRLEWLHDENLDNEFAIDRHGRRSFVGGLTDGDDDGSRVKRLWAGYTCAAH